MSSLSLNPISLVAGESMTPEVQVTTDGETRPASPSEFRITSSDTSVVAVAGSELTAVGDGHADITVSWIAAPSISVTRTVTISTEALTGVQLAGPRNLIPGDSGLLVVTGTIGGGRNIAHPASVTITSRAPTVVTATGDLLLANATGQSWVVATAATGVTDSILVAVAPGAPAHLTITPESASLIAGQSLHVAMVSLSDRRGNAVANVVPTFASTGAAATVQSDGTVTGVFPGSAMIIATAGTAADTLRLTVTGGTPLSLQQLTVAPDSVTLSPGGSAQVSVQAFDNLGNPMTSPVLTWTSLTNGITVSSSGLIAASSTISSTIPNGVVRVSSGAITAQVRVAVVVAVPVLQRLVVTPDSVTLSPGGTAQISVQAFDNLGNPMTSPVLTWTSASNGISVSSSGLIAASTTISNTIPNGVVRVSSGAITAQVRVAVVVAVPVLQRLVVVPDSVTLSPGGTAQISVQAFDTHGAAMTLPPLTWQSLTAGISVSSAGLITAASSITSTIPNGAVRVSSGAITAQVRVAVVVSPTTGDFVQVRWVGALPSASVMAGVEAQRNRLNALFNSFAGVTPVSATVDLGVCMPGSPAVHETVNGLVIFIQVTPIDGRGAALANTGVCVMRDGTFLPVLSTIRLDSDDLDAIIADGTFNGVVLHEMMHALGFGTIWGPGRQSQVAAPQGTDPRYFGSGGQSGYAAIGGMDGGSGVPVENTGGNGTQGIHWRESVFHSELMTGWADGSMPLSRATLGALRDFGYDVNLSRADAFSLTASVHGASLISRRQIGEIVTAPIGLLGRDGRIIPFSGQ